MIVATLSDTTLAVLVGLATAVGASVGGLVTIGAEWLRQRFAESRDNESSARDLRIAARLVKQDVEGASGALKIVLQYDEWALVAKFEMPAWQRQREVLASSLPDDDWEHVSTTVGLVTMLSSRIPGNSLDPDGRATMEHLKATCDEAAKRLAPFAKHRQSKDTIQRR